VYHRTLGSYKLLEYRDQSETSETRTGSEPLDTEPQGQGAVEAGSGESRQFPGQLVQLCSVSGLRGLCARVAGAHTCA
jgi:hypothetical protein